MEEREINNQLRQDEPTGTASRPSKRTLILSTLGVILGVAVATFLGISNSTTPEFTTTNGEANTSIEDSVPLTDIPNEESPVVIKNTIDNDSAIVAVEKEYCAPPSGLTEMQQYLHFGGCDYIVVETLEDGSLILVSGKEEYFQTIEETSSQVSVSPRKGSSSSGSGSNGSGNSSPSKPNPTQPAPPPAESAAPAPQPSYENNGLCPTSRSENPAVYDACYGGFSAPSLRPVGIVSCSPANEERTSWNIVYRFELTGGSYRSPAWMGANRDSDRSANINMTVNGVGEESFGNRIPVTYANILVSFGSMDPRYLGSAGEIGFSDIVEDDYSACR